MPNIVTNFGQKMRIGRFLLRVLETPTGSNRQGAGEKYQRGSNEKFEDIPLQKPTWSPPTFVIKR